jgi:uncharacterized protein involved in exopolysaccharide biosynthesis
VDRAVPPEVRIKPQRKLIVAIGGVAGFVVGVGAAFVLNLLRRKRAARAPASPGA